MAQGRSSSPNLYSFSVSDMGQITISLGTCDFIDPHSLAQLADDATILADGIQMLDNKMRCLLAHSKEIYQVPNIQKTVYCHLFRVSLNTNEEIKLFSVNFRLFIKCWFYHLDRKIYIMIFIYI